jgi:hypothetical protein
MAAKELAVANNPVERPGSAAAEESSLNKGAIFDYFDNEVEAKHTDLMVLTTCFTTGLVDTTMFASNVTSFVI